jgi:hypothetical protein
MQKYETHRAASGLFTCLSDLFQIAKSPIAQRSSFLVPFEPKRARAMEAQREAGRAGRDSMDSSAKSQDDAERLQTAQAPPAK